MTLVLIGLVGGLITGVSPCVLPVLPIVLLGGGSAASDAEPARGRPYLVVLGLTLSFAVFTLFGSVILASLHLPGDTIRWLGLGMLVLVGLGLLVPSLGHLIERPFYRFPQRALDTGRHGFVLGIAMGAVFVPCAGPVLAAITVAGATGHIGLRTVGLTLGFAVGTAIPLLAFALAGRRMAQRLKSFRSHRGAFRVVSGVVVVGLALALTFNLSDIVQRDIPNYTQSAGNFLEKSATTITHGGRRQALQSCQAGAYYGGGLQDCGPAPAFTGIQQWLNTPNGQPVTRASLAGKVVLVDFWAYSCINCQRELPHVEAWAKDYGRDGFEVVGVHTPEYAFEHVPANVEAGAKRLGLTFPIALDNSYTTWNAYDNQSWPASYLIDAQGVVRHVSIGEGGYSEDESLVRQLLDAAHPGGTLPPPTEVADTTPDDPAQTPETYLGAEREQYYGGAGPYTTGHFDITGHLAVNKYALSGNWKIGRESITSGDGAAITLLYHASRVYLDTGGRGTLTVTTGDATKVINVSGAPDIFTVASTPSAANGLVTIHLSPGLSAYSFTFG